MGVNHLNLRYFEVVARTQHYTKAAQELFITQSALSKAIANLEEEVGVPLFEKNGRNIQLTHYGKIFRDYVIESNKVINEGIHQIQDMANVMTGNIAISSIYTMGVNFIPQLISEYILQYPDSKIEYYQNSTKEILADIKDGRIDIGFCGEIIDEADRALISQERVLTEQLCLLVRNDHHLARRESINFEEVLDETFVGYNQNTGIIHSIEKTLKKAGFDEKLKYSFFATEDNTIASMVRAGLGIGLISNIPSIHTEGLARIKIDYPHFYRNLYMIWNNHRYMSPAAKNFRNFVLTNNKNI